jgi:uncharacterized protein (DUF2132 family)
MAEAQVNNPLHGVTLEMVLKKLVAYYGWQKLGAFIPVKCFLINPDLQSSLKFLRKTDWARKKTEALYLDIVNR